MPGEKCSNFLYCISMLCGKNLSRNKVIVELKEINLNALKRAHEGEENVIIYLEVVCRQQKEMEQYWKNILLSLHY